MIRYRGRAVPGFALGDASPSLRAVLADVRRFAESLTPREVAILRIGLEASHLEESVVVGDWARADAHAEKLTKLLAHREGEPRT